MMKLKKRVLILLVSAALVLEACSSKEDTPAETVPKERTTFSAEQKKLAA